MSIAMEAHVPVSVWTGGRISREPDMMYFGQKTYVGE